MATENTRLTKRQKALVGKVDSTKLYPLDNALALDDQCVAVLNCVVALARRVGLDGAGERPVGRQVKRHRFRPFNISAWVLMPPRVEIPTLSRCFMRSRRVARKRSNRVSGG